ncbi:MAG: ribose-phosphate pyrophosphokinase [Thaumarchaeota archaeon]|nr:MAG: ribose-phosphate pyrophosphokinase [Nitrososphaerota archaeon]
MPEIFVIAGPASPDLADRVAKGLGAHLVATELRVFSDGESKIKIDKMGKNCVIVQSTYPPADTHLMQALMMAIKCADGAHDVCAVIPYLAYARQDRAFLEGEVVSIAIVAKLLQSAGVRHVVTVDIHSKLAMSHFASVQNVSSIPLLAEYASRMMLCRPIAVSPDAGGADRAKEFAKHSKIDALVLKKSRDRTTGEVKVEEKLDIDVSGRDALLVDDMISSGGSIVKAAEVLHNKGAGKVYAMCAHALLIGDAAQKIKAAGVQDIIATNSVPGEYAKVDLSPAIVEVVKSRYSSA